MNRHHRQLKVWVSALCLLVGASVIRWATLSAHAKAPGGATINTGSASIPLLPCVVDPVVANNGDSGAGSLRQAIADACDFSTITFASSVTSPITLASELAIDKDLRIQGPGANLLTISGNHAVRVFNIGAGMVFIDVQLSGLTIANGLATDGLGGGILNNSTGTVEVLNSTLSGNTASNAASGFGGGVANGCNGTLNILSSTLSGNSASGGTDAGGGGIHNNGAGTVNVINSTLYGNSVTATSAEAVGGGINNNDAGTVNVVNSTLSGNSANGGGGSSGGGIYNLFEGEVNVQNTIIALNLAASGPDVSGDFISYGYNLIGKDDGSAGFTEIGDQTGTIAMPLDPKLGPLQFNGGPTQTMALQPTSPAIDQGSFAFDPATFSLIVADQRGVSRPMDDPMIPSASGGDDSDIGAFEVDTCGGSVVINTNDSGTGSLRCAIASAFTGGTVTFNIPANAPGCVGNACTITLSSYELAIDKDLTIQGPGANLLTVSGDQLFSVFNISASMQYINVTLSGLTIANGLCFAGGGIMNNSTGTVTVADSAVINNSVESFGVGGGIANLCHGTMNILNSTLSGNSADDVGGAVFNDIGIVNITNSTLSGNFADFGGGGIHNESIGTVNVINSTLSGNTAGNSEGGAGAGILNFCDGAVNLINSTLSGNSVSGVEGGGGGIANFGMKEGGGDFALRARIIQAKKRFAPRTRASQAGVGKAKSRPAEYIVGAVTLKNTIVAGNTAAFAPDVFGEFTSQGYNLIGKNDDSTGFTNGVNNDQVGTEATPLDPLLGPLAGNGGPTQTRILLPGSPAIDKGSAATDPNSGNPLTTDQRGQLRPLDFLTIANAMSGNGSDIGAVEVQCPTFIFSPSVMPTGAAGVAYNQSITISGGVGPYTATLMSGSLPAGLMFSATPAGGVVSGTPTQTGSFNFTLKATDANGCMSTGSLTLVINCPAITLGPATLPGGQIYTSYNQSLTATPAGTTYSFAVTSGALPTGLTLASNGTFSGAPTQGGTFNFRVTATGFGACTGFRDYQLIVTCPAITLNPASLPGGTLGVAYNQTVAAQPAGAYNYSVTSGALPSGLSLNSGTGAITGTPTQGGTFNFRITAITGVICSGFRDYTLTINCPPATLTPNPLPAGQAGVFYSQQFVATPPGDYTFIVQGNLPSGLSLSPSGLLSGLLHVVGTTSFIIKATTGIGCSALQSYTLVVNCPNPLTLNPASLPNGTLGTAYNASLSASPAGGNYTFVVTTGSLPSGLLLNSATGVISGTPTTSGSFNFRITATGFGTCTNFRDYTVQVGASGCPAITLTTSLPNGNVGQLYSNAVAASPAGSYSYTVTTGSLPPGLTLFGSFGLLFGYPTTAGSYTFTITATAGACTGSQQYTVLVGAGFLAKAGDFDGDGKADAAVFRGPQANWLVVQSSNNVLQTQLWGAPGDQQAAGDYDGDGKVDLAVFTTTGHWRIKRSSDGTVVDKLWGLATDVPAPGDYDGDGKTDIAVWRGSEGNWYIANSSNGAVQTVAWGASYAPYNDVAVPGDYDGDKKTDLAIFRKQNGTWYIKRSSDGTIQTQAWGLGTDTPVPGDYDGDGKTDIAVWRGQTSTWFIIRSGSGLLQMATWGASYAPYNDVPVPGDYDGDGKTDIAVWRPGQGMWYSLNSSDGQARIRQHGQAGDTPVTAKSH